MNNEINTQDKIDKFLLGLMDEKEQKEFELQMENNPELKESVELQKMIVDEINERESFMTILQKAEAEKQKKGKVINFNFRQSFAYAAVLAGVILLVWQPFKSSGSEIFDTYGIAIPASELSQLARGGIGTRGGSFYFDNFSPADNDKIAEALNLYSEEKYIGATEVFEQVLSSPKRSNELILYMAISQLYADEILKAIENLEYLNSHSQHEIKDKAEFYLALAYIKNGNTLKAKGLLRKIKEKDNEFSERAAKIIDEMRWF